MKLGVQPKPLSAEVWRQDAVCRDPSEHGLPPDAWFPSTGTRLEPIALSDENLEAKSLCYECPVSSPCVAYAITWHIHYGIWGGVDMSTRERRNYLKGQGE